MSTETSKKQEWALASIDLHVAFTDFILSRQAMLCSPATVKWYSWTLGKFLEHLKDQDIDAPLEIQARHVRQYLSEIAGRGLSDSYVHNHARAIKTFLRFCHAEDYMDQLISFKMPRIGKKRLPILNASELKQLLAACDTPRDLAVIMFMADTGVRRSECLDLNWGDLNLDNGVVKVAYGKGRKARSVVAGIKTRRVLLKYRITGAHNSDAPLFQSRKGGRLSASGLRHLLLRVGKRAGIDVSAHVLRRTFATLSLRSGMNVLQLQGLLGHSTLEMTKRYVQMVDADLVAEHQKHGPIDNL
ncbi:MAG: hypothetical protein DWG76_03035 [Chloroflexi bacterium]|nr:hypothetical protein [Chloroflexota bacterium]